MTEEEMCWFRDSLLKIEKIVEKHRYADEILGRRFNLFQIIRGGHEEVPVHSAFLGALLNHKGSHGMGNAFQKLFLEGVVNEVGGIKVDVEEPLTICIEKSFADGRMDICMENRKTCIVIENKIYAGDQNQQVARYIEYTRRRAEPGNRLVLYLTLGGYSPSDQSTAGVGASEFCSISYRKHILTWLERCLLVAIHKPYLRENINQYMDLLKQLTGTSETSMSNEIKRYLLEKMNTSALAQMREFQNAVDELQDERAAQYLERIIAGAIGIPGVTVTSSREQIIRCRDVRIDSAWKERGYLMIQIPTVPGVYIKGWFWSEAKGSNSFASRVIMEDMLPKTEKNRIRAALSQQSETFEFKDKSDLFADIKYYSVPIDVLRNYEWFEEHIMTKWVDDVLSAYTLAIKCLLG